jgi:glycosyltransferase involved in cell wall biosynthesis
MRRQLAGIRSLDLKILCWQHCPTTSHPLPNASVHSLHDSNHLPYYDGRARWLYRFYNAGSGNFYRVLGSERRKVVKLLHSVKPASILCYYGDIALRLVDVSREFQIPLIAYFHGDFRFNHDRWYRRSLQTRLKQFAAVIVVTEKERAWMREHGVTDDKLYLIPVGAPTSAFLPKTDRNHEGVRFVMAHRLADEKGCKESVLAFASVASQCNDVFLEIYGDGPERASLERLVGSLGLEHLVNFHGVVDEQRLASALTECDVFIQHSLRREGAPAAIVEAMSCGLPVVATAVGGILDQIVDGSTGFIVGEHDIAAMSRAMLLLASDEALRKTLGQNGRKRAVELFDCSLLTGRLEQVIADVTRSCPGREAKLRPTLG